MPTVLLLFVLSTSARADLYSTEQSYLKHDFDTAFKGFKELAELGQPTAQYDLAVMYVRGEGIPTSLTYAHAWASLAKAGGSAKAAALVDQLTPQLTPASMKISSEIQTQFGRDKLEARLMPHFLRGREYVDRDPVRPLKPFSPDYPAAAQMHGVQGEVYVEFKVAPDGRARMPRILYALPVGYFEDTVRFSIMRSSFLPARINGQPISATASVFFNFKIKELEMGAYGDLAARVRDTEAKAQAGDVRSQMLLGMMIAGLPQLHKTYDQALPWFLKAAQAGSPYAQYQIGTGLLRGHGCECDETKGEIWLQKAAQSDQPDAQVTLAEHLLEDRSNSEAVKGAITWLERAANNNSSAAKLQLSAILAADSNAELRNPTRALALTEKLESEYREDPTYWEIRAAANSQLGDFKTASKFEEKAINMAKRFSWNLTNLQQRQLAYASGQAWTGDLLNFD